MGGGARAAYKASGGPGTTPRLQSMQMLGPEDTLRSVVWLSRAQCWGFGGGLTLVGPERNKLSRKAS